MGARALQRWLTRPLRSHAELNARYDAVGQLGEPGARGSGDEILRVSLKEISDVERILLRLGGNERQHGRDRASVVSNGEPPRHTMRPLPLRAVDQRTARPTSLPGP